MATSAIRARISRALAPFLVLVFGLAPTAASAQLFRAYLAIDGNDANPCTLAAPCRLLPAALTAVADGGEIWMLDSANYNTGPVVIAKSVTILAIPGALGSVVALGGEAITMTAGRVTLRNLNILPFPANPGVDGIHVTGGTALQMEGCHVTGFLDIGVWIEAAAQLAVLDSVFASNNYGIAVQKGGAARITGSHFSDHPGAAIYVVPQLDTETAAATVTRSSIATSGLYGALAYAYGPNSTARLHVIDSTIEGGNGVGVGAYAAAVTGPNAEASVSNSLVVRNAGAGLRTNGIGATLVASGNTVVRNATGLTATASGVFNTTGTNAVSNNGTDISGTMTNVGLH